MGQAVSEASLLEKFPVVVLGGYLPPWGLCPPLDPLRPPPWAEGLPEFWAPPVAGLLMWATRPLFWFCGGHPPQPPAMGAPPPPLTPFAHPRGLRACQRFGPHSWRVC
jgi:hypothetical protein